MNTLAMTRHVGALTLAMLLPACATGGPASSAAVDPATEFEGDGLLCIEGGRAQQQIGLERFALEPGLGERWALVGEDGLLPDQGDGALPAELAQGGRDLDPGKAGGAGGVDHRAGIGLARYCPPLV